MKDSIKLTKEQRLQAWKNNAGIYLWMLRNQKWFQMISGGTFAFSLFSLITLKLTTLPLPIAYVIGGIAGLLVAYKIEEGLAEFSETTFRDFANKPRNRTERALRWMKLMPTIVLALITSVGSILIAPALAQAVTENKGTDFETQIKANNEATLDAIKSITESDKAKSKEVVSDKKEVAAYYDDAIKKAQEEAKIRADGFESAYVHLMNEPWYKSRYESFKRGDYNHRKRKKKIIADNDILRLKKEKKDELKSLSKSPKSSGAVQVALTTITKSTENLSRAKSEADEDFEIQSENMTTYIKYVTIVSTLLVLLFVAMRVSIERLCLEFVGDYSILNE